MFANGQSKDKIFSVKWQQQQQNTNITTTTTNNESDNLAKIDYLFYMFYRNDSSKIMTNK